jgi:NAD(P)-dependent dehydrogenase (short-subunit alcohol dehydrogenase family)
MADFKDKVALVTGGASGIGRATARRFARAGARLVIGDISPAGAEAAAEINAAGGQAVFLETDVTSAAACEALVQAALSRFGRLDAAANVAGIAHKGGMFCAPAVRDRTIAVNLLGVINAVVAQAEVMQHAGSGAIVNVASITGIQGSADSPYYAAAKHAVIGFTKSAALELAAHGIRVNAICPGFTLTPMTAGHFGGEIATSAVQLIPLGRVGQPEDQANAIVWLCSEEAAYISGASLSIDGALAAGPKSYLKAIS